MGNNGCEKHCRRHKKLKIWAKYKKIYNSGMLTSWSKNSTKEYVMEKREYISLKKS